MSCQLHYNIAARRRAESAVAHSLSSAVRSVLRTATQRATGVKWIIASIAGIAAMSAMQPSLAEHALANVRAVPGGDGSEGFVLKGVDPGDQSGFSVGNAGDVNADGVDDLIIGAVGALDEAGESYVVFGRTAGFPAVFELSRLFPAGGGDGSDGIVLKGIDRLDASGCSVSGAGDVNGDGIDDLIIGAKTADPNQNYEAGESYVVFGSTAFPAAIQLRGLLPLAGGDGSAGLVLKGVNSGDYSGKSVSAAGDLNGDGIDDVIIGAYRADPNAQDEAGESYVVFGRSTGFPAAFALRNLFPGAGGDGSTGFVLNGIKPNDGSGGSVSSAGDVNGDGIDDLIIGARAAGYGNSGIGASYVVFGRATGFPAAFELASLFPQAGGDGSEGFVLKGVGQADFSGGSVSDASDVNGDGIDDLIIGAAQADPDGRAIAGESYVVFGRATGFTAIFELQDLFPQNGGDGSEGFVLKGVDFSDQSGWSVSGAGDVNGDGIDDLIIGAKDAEQNGHAFVGESYVVFGRGTGFPAAFELRSLFAPAGGDGSEGFVLKGIDEDDQSGWSVSGAGDVNGDGIDDLILGARQADPNGHFNAGESYVVLGRATGFPAVFQLRTLLPH